MKETKEMKKMQEAYSVMKANRSIAKHPSILDQHYLNEEDATRLWLDGNDLTAPMIELQALADAELVELPERIRKGNRYEKDCDGIKIIPHRSNKNHRNY